MSIGDILTLILGSITIIGTAIAIVRWYKNNSVKNVTQKFNNDKINNITFSSYYLKFRSIKVSSSKTNQNNS